MFYSTLLLLCFSLWCHGLNPCPDWLSICCKQEITEGELTTLVLFHPPFTLLFVVVPRVRIELTTRGFSVLCSTTELPWQKQNSNLILASMVQHTLLYSTLLYFTPPPWAGQAELLPWQKQNSNLILLASAHNL